MKRYAVVFFAVLTAFYVGLFASPVSAAMAPSGIGALADTAQPALVEQARWGHRGGGWGRRGFAHRGFAPRRAYYRPVHVRRYYGRPYRARPIYWGPPRPVYRYSCMRRGWVWNGWRYVWRRYRVC